MPSSCVRLACKTHCQGIFLAKSMSGFKIISCFRRKCKYPAMLGFWKILEVIQILVLQGTSQSIINQGQKEVFRKTCFVEEFLQQVFSLLLSSIWCWIKPRIERQAIRFHVGLAVSVPHYVFVTQTFIIQILSHSISALFPTCWYHSLYKLLLNRIFFELPGTHQCFFLTA